MEENGVKKDSSLNETINIPATPHPSGNKKYLPFGVGIFLLLLGAILYFSFGRHNNSLIQKINIQAPFLKSSSDPFLAQYGHSCEQKNNVTFTYSPLALDKMSGIEPLGKTEDGHVTPSDHTYILPINQNVADNTYEILMPADGRVVGIQRMPSNYIGDRKDVRLPPDDFRLVISYSCRYFSIFIHVHKLGPALSSVGSNIQSGGSQDVNIPLKAGDLLAYSGGSGVDWGMVDTQTVLSGFITPSLYQSELWKIHSISPFDVYTGELKKSLEDKSLRTIPPLGGKIDWDLPGALRGNWFRQGTNGYQGADMNRYWDGHLSIAPNNVDPTAIIYSTGNWQGTAKQLVIKGNFDPATIVPASGVVKIELFERHFLLVNGQPFPGGFYTKGMTIDKTHQSVVGTVLLQVEPKEKLRVEQFPGKTADQVSGFTNNAQIYER